MQSLIQGHICVLICCMNQQLSELISITAYHFLWEYPNRLAHLTQVACAGRSQGRPLQQWHAVRAA